MNNRFVRQILAFAEEGQARISGERVAVVGLGGLGSHLVQGLAYLGVRDFVFVDPDFVDETNLNRLVGANWDDLRQGYPKTVVAERLVRAVEPGARITTIQADICSEQAIAAVKSCTTIFGAVDEDGPRLLLMELACAYRRVLIDCASDILLDESRTEVSDFGGRVVLCRPGDFCLLCAEELDLEAAKAYFESPGVNVVREKHGYGLGPSFPSPSVVSLNGVVANIALTEFLMMTTGLREPKRKRVYQGLRGVMLDNKDAKKDGCYNCEYLVGLGDRANVLRYVRERRPSDLEAE